MKRPVFLQNSEVKMIRTAVAAATAAFLLAGCDAIPSVSKAIVGTWECDGHTLAFADDGAFSVYSKTTKATYKGTYLVVEPKDSKQGSVETAPSPYPLSHFKYIKSAPNAAVDAYTSMKGLILYSRSGELMQCLRPRTA